MTGMKLVVVLACSFSVASVGAALAGQQRPYRVSDQQLKDLVNRIDTHGDAFRDSIQRAIDRTPINGSPAEGQLDRSVKDFEQASDLLRSRVNDRQSSAADAENVLRRASVLDDFMARNRLETAAQRDWQALRLDMNDLARAYAITWNWSAASQTLPYRVDDEQVEQLLTQIAQKAQQFDKDIDRAFEPGWNDDRRGKEAIRQSVKDFRQATDRLRDRVTGRQSNTLDVEEVLRRGEGIDGFMQRRQLSVEAERRWLSLRGDLDGLARAYNVAWNWGNARHAPAADTGLYHRLTGTYQLDPGRGDDPQRAAEVAARAAPSDRRERTYQNLLHRLEAPEMIAIERKDNGVTMASTRGQPVSFEADGRDRSERWPDGATVNTRATFEGERLVVATTGNRGSDYTVTFEPMDDGRGLQMTRTIHELSLRQPVTVRHFYRRTADQARWNMEAADDPDLYATHAERSGPVVPDGTRLMASLDNDLSTTSAREGDPFTMTIRSPSDYEGAVIHGFVSTVNESERQTGRAGLMLNLRSIRLRNGNSYRFDGVIEGIRTPDGNTVRVDREGTAGTDDSRTQRAVERAALGAALGAVIGAVAGGGKGAAIGAAIGAGGGAGTVLVEGRDRLDLPRGTEVTITSRDSLYPRTYSRVEP